MKIAFIMGARPQLMKMAVICPGLRELPEHRIIHTGQHDTEMNDVFLRGAVIPANCSNRLGGTCHGRAMRIADVSLRWPVHHDYDRFVMETFWIA